MMHVNFCFKFRFYVYYYAMNDNLAPTPMNITDLTYQVPLNTLYIVPMLQNKS